ncbi:MAG: transporter substrate-binding domain-containing protein [Helicobacteraceae bacterium]|nr:transporter substrate-binding domain-containing protein [Helicobacteraceae bacterium]
MIKNFMLTFILLTSAVFAKEVQTVFSYSTPPYVFKDGSGIVIDIITESLKSQKHTVKPVFVNISRSFEMFKYGYVDATTIIKKNSGLEAYYSEYFMQYHNAAFALKSNKYKIKELIDLKDLYFISFQNATKYLGNKFEKIALESGNKYSEEPNQKKQVYKLLKGRTDIAILDRHIFKFYKNELISEGKVDKNIQVELFELFEPTKYRTAFKDRTIRDDFNFGLKKLKASGRYDEIYDHYSSKYFKVEK